MHAATLSALEFDRIQELVADRTLTPLGRALAFALEPSGDPAVVTARLTLTTEGLAFVRANGSLGLWAPEDLQAILENLEVDGQTLDPLQLIGLSRFIGSVDRAVNGIRRSGQPALTAMVKPLLAATSK